MLYCFKSGEKSRAEKEKSAQIPPSFQSSTFGVSNNTLQTQQAEIQYLLTHKEAILDKLPPSKKSAMLASFDVITSSKNRNHGLNYATTLEEINAHMLEVCIEKSQNSDNPRFLDCRNAHLTRLPAHILLEEKYQAYWDKVEIVDLSNNALCLFNNALPKEIMQLKGLTQLITAETNNAVTRVGSKPF